MPLAIFLKEPKIQVFAKGDNPEIDSITTVGKSGWISYDQLEDGKPMWIPVDNIAMIQVISDEEIKKMKKDAEERKTEAERRAKFPPQGGKLVSPGFVMPGGRRKH